MPTALQPRRDITVVVTRGASKSDPVVIPASAVGDVAPALATQSIDGVTSRALLLNSDGSFAGPGRIQPSTRPLEPDDTATAYATALGGTNPAVPDGQPAPFQPLAQTSEHVEVFINGVSQPVLFSGLAPGMSGVYEVKFRVDAKTPVKSEEENRIWLKVKGVESAPVLVSLANPPYLSPSCGPAGGSTSWACGAWPATTPPWLGAAGTTTTDPDTGARVLRVTESGSFGEDMRTAFKVFDAGSRRAWNADSTRILVLPWSDRGIRSHAYWVGFDPYNMKLTGRRGRAPDVFSDFQWDETDPNLMLGLVDDVAKTYSVWTGAWSVVLDVGAGFWDAAPRISVWGANRVCIVAGPQDDGYKVACANRDGGGQQLIDLHRQTINGVPFHVYFNGRSVRLPSTTGVHSATLAPDGRSLAIDTHGNTPCSSPRLPQYDSTAIFLNLDSATAYEWDVSCGATHWAYGYDGILMQSTSPNWTPAGKSGPCNPDSRGIARRRTDAQIDSSFEILQPCSVFRLSTWLVNVHLTWLNNVPDPDANARPVVIATTANRAGAGLLWNEIAAAETTGGPYSGRLWRLAQTWNDPTSRQCGFLNTPARRCRLTAAGRSVSFQLAGTDRRQRRVLQRPTH